MSFLPISKEDMQQRGWDEVDFCIITGDAYVDHPSFGTAIISRVLEHAGYKVGIISQPKVGSHEDIMRLGKPRLGFMVNAGNIDSMVAHYTAAKKKRSEDAYSPGGKAGMRPDRAVIVYSKLVRACYGRDMPIIIGGIEASLRRFAHYDYWSDTVMPSILIDSSADLLSFG
ncbi:MAG: YgiQ family radical SAM protein, partial [Oscillospiraceae bacterium]